MEPADVSHGLRHTIYFCPTAAPICCGTPLRYPNSYYIPRNCHQLNIYGSLLPVQWGNTGLTGSITTQYLKTKTKEIYIWLKSNYIHTTPFNIVMPFVPYGGGRLINNGLLWALTIFAVFFLLPWLLVHICLSNGRETERCWQGVS
jgi:hypothetical protein